MASFEAPVEGSLVDRSLEGRFARDIGNAPLDVEPESIAAWVRLLGDLRDTVDPLQAFDVFLRAVETLPPRLRARPRVFISHRRVDADYAEQIAWLAAQNGLEYWLDVHDPRLNAIPPGDPKYSVLVAAAIEIGLLNCTHVIAAHTPPRPVSATWIPSQWIPYELGRAKARSIYSTQAASWFQSTVSPPESRGEYVLLGEICRAEPAVVAWLQRESPNPGNPKPFRGSGARRPLN